MADYKCRRKCMLRCNGWCLVSSGERDHFARWKICSIALREDEKVRKVKGQGKGWAQIIEETMAFYPDGITATELSAILHSSAHALRNYLNDMTKKGILIKSEMRRSGVMNKRHYSFRLKDIQGNG